MARSEDWVENGFDRPQFLIERSDLCTRPKALLNIFYLASRGLRQQLSQWNGREELLRKRDPVLLLISHVRRQACTCVASGPALTLERSDGFPRSGHVVAWSRLQVTSAQIMPDRAVRQPRHGTWIRNRRREPSHRVQSPDRTVYAVCQLRP